MTNTLQIPPDRAVFVFSDQAAHVQVDVKLTHYEDDPVTPLAVEFRTLTQIIVVFLTSREALTLRRFLNSPATAPGHCTDY